MNSSHLVTSMNTHQHHPHHTHHTNTTPHHQTSLYGGSTTKMPTTNNNNNFKTNDPHAGLSAGSTFINKTNNSTTHNSPSAANANLSNVGAGLTLTSTAQSAPSSTNTSTSTSSPSYKFAPARRLAARQTLRLAIPKQPGDSTQLNSTSTANSTVANNSIPTQMKYSSPSQLPPAPILKRTPVNTPNFGTPTSSTFNSHIPKSASPLESHNLPNVLQHSSNTPICTAGTATPSSGGSNKFLRVRNPSITLNSSDIGNNNNDLFAFAKEFSSPAVGGGGEF